MQRGRGGYTIIEVMIVLAVGTITFFAAVSLFAGKQGKTEFSQGMRDIQTQIQSIVNDVGVSNYPGTNNWDCDMSPPSRPAGRPVVSLGSGGIGSSEKCIFLGKAVHIIDLPAAPHRLAIYTVLGSRLGGDGTPPNPPTTYNSNSATGVNPEIFPTPPASTDFVETYNLPFRVRVLSAHEDTNSDEPTYMLGFYNSLQSSTAAVQGSQSLTTIGYIGFDQNTGPQARTVIRGVDDDDEENQAFSKAWTICFQSGTSNERAELIVSSSFSGVTTTFSYRNCS